MAGGKTKCDTATGACATGCYDIGDGRNCTTYLPFGPNDEYHMKCTLILDGGNNATTATGLDSAGSKCEIVMARMP